MPFTISHIAIILPLRRWPRWFDLTALTIGSMAPDFAYFMLLDANAMFGHTKLGLVLFDLPITIIAAFLFHRLLKASLIAHLPAPFDRRLWPVARTDRLPRQPKEWRFFCYSALLGALSHILWDAFTHEGELFVELWPMLTTPIKLGWVLIPIYDLLQYGCSLFGLLIVIVAIWRLGQRPPAIDDPLPLIRISARQKCYYWLTVCGCSLMLGLIRIGMLIDLVKFNLIIEFIVAAITGGLLGVLVGARAFRVEWQLK